MPSKTGEQSNGPAIGVYQVGKTYRVYDSSWDRLRGHLLEAMPKPTAWLREKVRGWLSNIGREFRALEDITLEIQPGESVGIIGRNGSGKSTLLQIIAGTRPPTSGSVKVRGRVAAILELGSGFKPDFTGRENVIINGLILGLSHAEITAKFPQIEAFADIGGFMDQPVKTYSSGMLVRLVFSVQVALEPDVLIVDEALAVGDVFFQQKCAERMKELKAKGTTILFVSHSMQVVRNLCEKVVLLQNGHLSYFGDTLRGTMLYFSNAASGSSARLPAAFTRQDREADSAHAVWRCEQEPGSPVFISYVRSLLPDGSPGGLEGEVSQTLTFEVAVENQGETPVYFHLGFNIKNRFDQLVCSLGSHTRDLESFVVEGGARVRLRVDVSLDLEPGPYTIHFGVGEMGPDKKWVPWHGTGWFGPLSLTWKSRERPIPFHGPFGLRVGFSEMPS
jgi:lipopolysaccharide transport system ATP-binding protein